MMADRYMNTSSAMKKIWQVIKRHQNSQMEVSVVDLEDRIQVRLEGFGLISYMDSVMDGSFNRLFVDEFVSLGRNIDSLKYAELFLASAPIIVDTFNLTAPSCQFVFYKQKVAMENL